MQLLAIISDTYRSLKVRGLYWVLFWISLLLGLVYASLGCSETGWSLFFGLAEFPSNLLRKGTEWEKSLLLTTLDGLMDYWMMTYAVLLALFPATTIFPDTMRPGAIDLLLSKPVSRFKLFFGKYLGALVFVAMLATMLTTICFLALLFRLETAYWGIFWSVGLTVMIFSVVYSLNALIGVLTRSSVAALLLTILFWFGLWLVQKVEFETRKNLVVREVMEASNPDMKTVSRTLDRLNRGTAALMNYLPRTRETGDLFRTVSGAIPPHNFQEILWGGQLPPNVISGEPPSNRSVWQVLRNGLIFNFLLLAIAYRHFATRDF